MKSTNHDPGKASAAWHIPCTEVATPPGEDVPMEQSSNPAHREDAMKSVVWTGVLLGIGLMGALDEIAFHQLLQWHNFYVHANAFWRIFSDGVFHAFTLTLLVLAVMRLWTQRRRVSAVVSGRPFWSGVLLGAGGFHLFDGIVNHKILQLHPVREGVENIWVYDLAWNVPAALVLLAGWLLWRSLRAEEATAPTAASHIEADHLHR